jgi:hypothetical protein
MGFWTAKVSDVKPQITDWLKQRGGSVSDLPLNLINRGRERIWGYRPWDFLCTAYALTVSNKSATLPADIGRILSVYHDSDSDGKPDWFYFRNDTRVDHRYSIATTVSLTAAPSHVMSWPTAPNSTPYVYYQKAIDDVSLDTHYLVFPRELVIRAAQLSHIIEKNLRGNEMEGIQRDFDRLMIDFEQVCQHNNNAMNLVMNDAAGDPICTEQYTMEGAVGNYTSPHDNSYDYGK